MNAVIAIVAAYLIGSISFAVVVSRLFGLSDPRTYGSKKSWRHQCSAFGE